MFSVKISGINDMKAQFAGATADMKEIVEQELKGLAKDWVAGSIRDAPVDEGSLKNSISFYQTDTNTAAGSSIGFAIVAQKFYAPFMEFGTKGKYQPIPGTEQIAEQFKGLKGGDFMTLLRMIVRWVKKKGITGTYSVKTRRRTGSKINQIAEDYSAAWPIALSILKNGINPHPYFFKQKDSLWPFMIDRIKQRVEQKSRVTVIMPGEIRRPRIITI